MAPDTGIPAWVTYPGERWEAISPTEAGLDPGKFQDWLDAHPIGPGTWEGESHGEGEWGCVLTRGGYLIHTWGNPDYRYQTASLGKAFTWALVGLSVDAGMIRPDEPIRLTWTGESELSHPHKYLDRGHHRTLTWQHLIGRKDEYEHRGGFPVTNGYFWRQGSTAQSSRGDPKHASVPDWAHWTGDPFYDNYAHAPPGSVGMYSSGGLWRLSQALTALWGRDMKAVMDERIFSHLRVPPERWDWTPGRVVHETRDWYPHMPGYGDYLDPPHEIGGHPVRGGPGWVVMSAKDLARFGLLVATRGTWRGERLVSADWVRGHSGGNGSYVGGESVHYTSVGRVTTDAGPGPLPDKLFVGPVKRAAEELAP